MVFWSAVCLCISCVFALPNGALSQNGDEMFNQYLKLNNERILAIANGDEESKQQIEKEIHALEKKLELCGYQFSNNLSDFISSEDGVQPMMQLPDDDDYEYVSWSQTTKRITKNGVTYVVKLITATPQDPQSTLVSSKKPFELQSTKDRIITKTKELITFWVSAGIMEAYSKLSSVFNFIPYELFLSENDSIQNNSMFVNYVCSSYVQFAYIRKANQKENQEVLCFVTNKAMLSYNVTLTGIRNGVPYNESFDDKRHGVPEYASPYYGDAQRILNSYLSNPSKTTDFVNSFKMVNSDGTKYQKVPVYCPTGIGQIY